MSPDTPIPPIPTIPKWPQVKVFLWGAIWTIGCALAPTGVIILDWVRRWDDPPDWTMIAHMSATSCIFGLIAYVRKHKALLQEPPKPPVQ